ncbi:hybrid sensor histidine kinase/response regulator [Desulfuromonas carbonis]|uniref:hybrid sensor histidine kinase/response regulator n=1 Tax=Desulfuromonas sp. DDH964 TaxID=1823759 RepID=UPI00078BDC80|nr:response regulator [Desulfuromonas sp. DDH964]AMV70797.1 sensor histidine kinase CheA associated with MCPs of class 44H [Desulfuromonas sp. DDH964]
MTIKKYLDIFAREAEEHLQALRQGSLALEQDGFTPERVHELLRSAHTLKGSARMLDLQTLGKVAHALEELLKEVEQGEREVTSGLIDLLLVAADALEALVAQAHAGGEIEVNVDLVLEGLATGVLPEVPAPREEPTPSPRRETVEKDTVRASVARLDQMVNLLGELLISRRVLEEHNRQLAGGLLRLETFLRRLRKAENYTLLRSILDDLGQVSMALEADTLGLSCLAEELHGEAMELRMLPLGTITEDLSRMVRTLAREQGKEAQLVVSGEEVELDRMMLEASRPMLLHMLRNAVDHGIEEMSERVAAGKPEAGRIQLAASTEGGFVHLRLSDDGCGIDPQRVRQVAINRGLLSPEEAAGLSDEEAVYLILRPGFSTREIVTDLSGRGVGMDVVKSQIDRVKGNLVIHSHPGKGTEMFLKLPLTMAVVTGLVVECEGEIYAVPLHYVSEIVRLAERDILTEGGQEVIRVRGATLPLLPLPDLLGAARRSQIDIPGRATALVLNFREQQLACLVTRTVNVQELVVKGMGAQLKSVRFCTGATILGNGLPALILSVPDLFSAGLAGTSSQLRQDFAAQRAARTKGRVLVVDDSITTRTMEKNILETHGYQVTVAVCGEEALARLAEQPFDLMVSDVEMPGMTGFELTAKVRQIEALRELPVIIVTSLASDADRRKGIEVGAQAYIVKGAFDQGTLLETVESLIG